MKKILFLAAMLALTAFSTACGDDDGGGESSISLDGFQTVRSGRFSNDGSRVAVLGAGGTGDAAMFTTKPDGSDAKLILDTGIDFFSTFAWAPDDQTVYFRGDFETDDGFPASGIYRINADGTGEPELIVDTFAAMAIDLSPDGTTLTWSTNGSSVIQYALVSDAPASGDKIVRTELEGSNPRFSPDGTKLVYFNEPDYHFADVATWTKTGDGPTGGSYLANADWIDNGSLIYLGDDKIRRWEDGSGEALRDAFAGTDLDFSQAAGKYVYSTNGGSSATVSGL